MARLEVHGGPGAAEPVARSVANSPLVKCALFGGDPSGGRLLAAAGQALPNVGEVEFDLSIEEVEVARSSVAAPLTDVQARRVDEAMKQPEVEMSLYFAACDEVTEIFSATSGRSTWRSTPSIRRESCRRTAPDRNAARMPSLHQGVLRQDGGDQVRRRSDGGGRAARAFATDVVLLKYVGINPVVVHGGGAEITEFMDRLGLEVEFVQGLRVSNEQTVEVAKMVLVGKLNKDIVLRLNRHGQPAVGLCGDDGSLFDVRKQLVPDADGEARDLGYVGSIERVDVDVLNHIAADYIPVVASVGADREGQSYNVNADEAAGAVAAALGAYKVIFMTDVEGWLAEPDDGGSLISEVDVAAVRRACRGHGGRRDAPQAQGMRGRRRGRRRLRAHRRWAQAHSLLLELFTHAGIGTKVRPVDE